MMKIRSSALIAGILFGFGLNISGMSNPDKVMNFMNVMGAWDASLLFVLIGAVITTFIGYKLTLRRQAPIFEKQFYLPTKTVVDKALLLGAALFGAGWGMTGFCPGPAVASLAFGNSEPWLFMLSMLAGYVVIEKFVHK